MFTSPKQAEFNRALPKSKIYAFAKPTRAVKDRIVSGIQDIVWKYKLAPETVNLPARHGIQEIQVRAVLDEIFCAANFVATVIWQKVYAPKSSARHFSADHDYIVGQKKRATLSDHPTAIAGS